MAPFGWNVETQYLQSGGIGQREPSTGFMSLFSMPAISERESTEPTSVQYNNVSNDMLAIAPNQDVEMK